MYIMDLAQKTLSKIEDELFINKNKVRPQDFTRNRKLSFTTTMMMILSLIGRSIQAGIDEFLNLMDTEFATYSKQAFSKGRQRILPEAFQDIHRLSVDFFYSIIPYKTYYGYRINAVDGSKTDLPFHKGLLDIYGCQPGTNQSLQCLISCLVDVLNHIVLEGFMAPCNGNERELARKHIQWVVKNRIDSVKELILFDRGYPSAELMNALDNAGVFYVMRCSQSFAASFLHKLNGDDCIITHKFSKSGLNLTFRVVKFPISDTENEILITNILDEFTISQFKEIYHFRWEIETSYHCIKNLFELESFSGATPNAVLQDFYATLYLYNAASVIVFENDAKTADKHKDRGNKYSYHTNFKMAILKVRKNLVRILLCDSEEKAERYLNRLIAQLERELVPIRNDRHSPHKRLHQNVKFPQNQKK